MILTGKAVDFVKNLEEEEHKIWGDIPAPDLTEDDQITLAIVTKTFMRDLDFREALRTFTKVYSYMYMQMHREEK